MYLKKFVLKIVRVVTSTTIKFEDFDFDNNLINGKSYKNILTDLLKFMMERQSVKKYYGNFKKCV